jgi:hypothetical protein
MSRTRLLGCVSVCTLAISSYARAQTVVPLPTIDATSQGSGSLFMPNTESARRDIQKKARCRRGRSRTAVRCRNAATRPREVQQMRESMFVDFRKTAETAGRAARLKAAKL